MPKTFINRTLGFDLRVQGPATSDEYDKAIGSKGACLENAVQYSIYHRWNGQFREAFADALVAQTGIERPQDGDKTVKVKDVAGNEVAQPVLVTEKKFLAKLIADKKITIEDAALLAQRVADEVGELDLSPSQRVSKIPLKALSKADSVLQLVEQGDTTPEDFIAKFEAKNPGVAFQSLGEWDRESIAKAIVVNQRRIEREAENDMLAD